jgi:two-component system NtrC family sensor kinase
MTDALPAAPAATRNETVRWLRRLLIASIVVPVTLFAFLAWENRDDVLQQANRRIAQTVDVLHEHAEKVFETDELLIAQVDQLIAGMSWDEIRSARRIHEALQRMQQGLPQVDTIWLVDPTGHTVNGSRFFPMPETSVADRDYFQALVAKDVGTFVSSVYAGRLTNRMQFNIARRVSTGDGRFNGVILISANPQYFSDFYGSISAGMGDAVTLLRNDGEILARFPPVAPNVTRLPPNAPSLLAAAKSKKGLYTALWVGDGTTRVSGFRNLETYPVIVFYGLSQSGVLGVWYENLLRYGGFGFAASLALLFATWSALRHARQEQQALARLAEEMQRRELTEEKLRQTQKMEAIGQLTGGIAHDFNNLLTVVSGNAEMLQLRGMPENSKRAVDAIMRAAERGERLTRQLLAFSRRQRLNPRTVDFQQRLGEIEELLLRSLRGDIEVKIDLTPELWPIEVDPSELELALLNIAVNARDAMPNGGVLRITGRNVRLDGTLGAELGLEGEFVALALTDTGGGIPADVLGRVFEPFFTTKEVGKGTGLGLSQVYGFAHQSGGTAAIRSEGGRGTEVTLYLPRAALAETAERTRRVRPELRESLAAMVLVVEDDEAVGDTAARLLETIGATVIRVGDAEAALRALEQGGAIDLVLSDIVMPGRMSGVDLAHEIRRRDAELPIILMTGYSDGASDAPQSSFPVIAKPFSAQRLADAARHSLAARRQSRPSAAPRTGEERVG